MIRRIIDFSLDNRLLVVALCFWAVRPRDDWPLAAIAAVGLVFTFTRAALLVLAVLSR